MQKMESEWRDVGSHSIRIIDDRLEMRQRGTLTLAEVMEYFRLVEEISAKYGYSLSLFDQHHAVVLEPAARTYMGQRARELSSPTALAVFGSSLPLRTMARLIVRAINMFRRPPLLLGFFGTEMEARAYLAMHRAEFRLRLRCSDAIRPAP